MSGPTRDEVRATFAPTTGGVMTEEAGAVTGDLELLCRPDTDGLHVFVRYAGTDEWYTVSGGPVRLPGYDLDDALEHILRHLTAPGPVVGGNEQPAGLGGLPAA